MQSQNQIKRIERLGGSKIRGVVIEDNDEQLEFINHLIDPKAPKK